MNIYAMKKPKRLNSFSVTMGLILLVLGYAGWFYLPHWWPVFRLTGMMRGVCNDGFRNTDDAALMAKLVKESVRTGLRFTADDFELEREPWSEKEIEGEAESFRRLLEQRGKSCSLTLYHEVDAELPLIGKPVHLDFTRTVQATYPKSLNYDETMPECRCLSAGRR